MTAAGDVAAPRWRSLLGSQFTRAVATLAAGQGLAALVPIVTAPILGRLYHPADYGALAMYMAVATLLASASALQMQNAVIAERRERRAIGLVSVCMASAAGTAVVAAFVSAGLIVFYRNDPAWSGLTGWLLLLPVTTFCAGTTAGIAALANRRSRYGFMARIQVVAVIATAAVSIALGALGAGAQGLFAGYFLQQAITFIAHVRLLRTMPDFRTEFRPRRLCALARRHTGFAVFTLPSEIVGQFNQSLPVFVLSAIGATPTLGAFNRARALVMMPFNLLGASIAQPFRQRAAQDLHESGSYFRLYKRTFWTLLVLGGVATVFLAVFSPFLFRIVLGPHWVEAGQIARLLSPMLLMNLVCSPLSYNFFLHGRQKEVLILMILTAISLGLSLIVAAKLFAGAHALIAAYSLTYTFSYAVFMRRSWLLAHRSDTV